MTEREIRAMLRGAVRKGILFGWYTTGFVGNRIYILSPYPFPCVHYTHNTAEDYCRMLKDAGVEPVYRESEPQEIP